MKTNYLYTNTRPDSFRWFSGILVVLLMVAFSAPAFAVCSCCDAMEPKTATAKVAPDPVAEEETPSCHASEPAATEAGASRASHKEEPATQSNAQIAVSPECQSECVKSISMTGFIAKDMVPASSAAQVKTPPASFTSSLMLASQSHVSFVRYESAPNLLAIHTEWYSTILPPRI